MVEFIKDNLILNDPMIVGANISILLTVIVLVFVLTYFKNGSGFGRNGLRPSTINALESCISYLHY